jgi:hypothetical protein
MSLHLGSPSKPFDYVRYPLSAKDCLLGLEKISLLPLMLGFGQRMRQNPLFSVRDIPIDFRLFAERVDQKTSNRHEGVMSGIDRMRSFAIHENIICFQQTFKGILHIWLIHVGLVFLAVIKLLRHGFPLLVPLLGCLWTAAILPDQVQQIIELLRAPARASLAGAITRRLPLGACCSQRSFQLFGESIYRRFVQLKPEVHFAYLPCNVIAL